MAKLLIAVAPLWDDERESIWMLPGYLDGVSSAGAIPVILPLHSSAADVLEVFRRCDGLLLTGGHDVSPALYHAEKTAACGSVCEARDHIEGALYGAALAESKPVLGICRGIQLINVLQGGTLYQDLPTEHASPVEHHMSPPYTAVAHDVQIRTSSPLYALLGTERLGVNSYHHQAIRQLGNQLAVMAESEDGLVEAVRHTEHPFVWGVQWHPEFDFPVNPNSRRLFAAFVRACQKR